MTQPTPEQIQRACDRANVGGADWCPAEYGVAEVLTALADTIAELDAEKARADKAVADLREIGSHTKIGADDCPMLAQIAARHRQAGVQQGLDMAAGVADGFDAPHVIDAGRKIAAAIRKLGGDDSSPVGKDCHNYWRRGVDDGTD